MMKAKHISLLTLLCVQMAAHAATGSASIRQAVENFLQPQMQGLPGQASFKVGVIGEAYGSEQCERLDLGMPANARPWGRTHVQVRCLSDGRQKWALLVPVQIMVNARYLVSARPVISGQVLGDADLQWMQGDLAEMPVGILTDASQAVGLVMTASIPAGRPFRSDMLRQPSLIQQGQNVKVVSVGPGFQATNEGRALNNAAIGQIAQIRLPSGSVISGPVRPDGTVEIKF